MDKPYFQLKVEEPGWDFVDGPVGQYHNYLDIMQYCPGNYDIVLYQKYCYQELVLYCKMGFHLLFKNKSDKIEWLLKYS